MDKRDQLEDYCGLSKQLELSTDSVGVNNNHIIQIFELKGRTLEIWG